MVDTGIAPCGVGCRNFRTEEVDDGTAERRIQELLLVTF
jgi:hypothetical protein